MVEDVNLLVSNLEISFKIILDRMKKEIDVIHEYLYIKRKRRHTATLHSYTLWEQTLLCFLNCN